MQTDKDDGPSNGNEPVRNTTQPPGNAVSVTEAGIALGIWEQIGLLLERYQLQFSETHPAYD